jgi:hypothetical protein
MNNFSRLISYVTIGIFSLANIASLSAQAVPVLGEIKSRGKVFISSSTGQWSPAMPTYPLLNDTGIKTEDGVASIFFKDGSKVDLSSGSVVSVVSTPQSHTIKLTQGVISFNVTPSSSLSVSAASADILAIGGKEPVLGNITVRGTCIEVKSFTGNIQATSSATGPKLLTSGGNALFGDCNVAAVPAYSSGETNAKYLILSGMGLLVVDSLLKSPYILNSSGHGDIDRGFW